MGTAASMAKKTVTGPTDKAIADTKEQLDMMIEMANSRLNAYQQKLRIGEYAHQFQIGKVLLKSSSVTVSTSTGYKPLLEGMNKMVSDVAHGEIAKTISTAVEMGMKAMFASSSGNVSEKTMYCVKLDGMALCLIDIYMYSYDVSAAGLATIQKQVFAHAYQVSTIAPPITKEDLSDLIGMMYTTADNSIAGNIAAVQEQMKLFNVLWPIFSRDTDDEKRNIPKTNKLTIDA